jgi:ferredoxin
MISVANLIAWSAITLIAAGLAWAVGVLAREGERRAATMLALYGAMFTVAWAVVVLLLRAYPIAQSAFIAVAAAFVIFLFIPTRSTRSALNTPGPLERFDERDVVFSRMDLEPGTQNYDDYYSGRPELKRLDDELRSRARLTSKHARSYSPLYTPIISSLFDRVREIAHSISSEPLEPQKQALDPDELTAKLKSMAMARGACLAGATVLDNLSQYSHVGRGPEPYGAPIETEHRYALAFAVEMDYDMVRCAPKIQTTVETARQYLHAAEISIEIQDYLRGLGYSARAHTAGSNYQAVLPAVAQDAGLGELGRMGILITEKYGARVRLGLVTTDAELTPDSPRVFGLQHFCEVCLKCAECCPSAAIPTGAKVLRRGVEKWQLDPERCYSYWRRVGTDCAVCMMVCPVSKPDNLLHSLVRAATSRSSSARRVAILLDDLLYGKRPEPRIRPELRASEFRES